MPSLQEGRMAMYLPMTCHKTLQICLSERHLLKQLVRLLGWESWNDSLKRIAHSYAVSPMCYLPRRWTPPVTIVGEAHKTAAAAANAYLAASTQKDRLYEALSVYSQVRMIGPNCYCVRIFIYFEISNRLTSHSASTCYLAITECSTTGQC